MTQDPTSFPRRAALAAAALATAATAQAQPRSPQMTVTETDMLGLIDVQPTFMPGGELADFNNDTSTDPDDLSDFITAFFASCG